jgi:catechol 2,3-dioxygenase-like lactoylglutathione lyase family enzyme
MRRFPQEVSMITHVKFVGIPTRDQPRALKFYTEQLGFEVATDQPFDEKQHWGTFAMFKDPDGNQFVLSSY